MTITNPTLVLTFLGGDLPAGHSTSQTITNAFIINRSISFSYQLLDGLKSSSNQVSLQISRASASVEDIIATDGDVKAVLKDGTTTLFTGYISTSFTWAVTDSGEQALKITLEDVSTRLFSKPFITSGYHLFNTNAQTAINVICASAGVTVSSSAVTVPGTVTKVVDSSLSCRDILIQMLYELGYVYYCDNLGELRFFEINCDSVSGLPVLDNTKLYTNGNQVVSLSKKIRQYRSVRMSFKTLGTASGYLVYRNTTGQDDTHPYCNLELEAGEHFDGLEVYTAQEWQAETADTFREDALVEACNAASETKIVGSNKIISVSNLSVISEKGSNISASITAMGGQYLKIDAENSGNSTQAITRLDAYGTILYENTTEIIRTGISGNTTDSLFSEELSYIHTRALAVKHANLVNQFQAYSNSLYTFYSKEDLDCGALVNLNENQFSGLNVNVLIINKAVSSSTDIIKYSAVGISVFDLDKDVYHRSTDTAKSDTKGASAEVQYALGNSLTEPPVEEMRWNDEPMAWGGDQMFWEIADFTNEVPTLVDGYYIWMRVRVGNGEWQYSRLTGETGNGVSSFTEYYALSTSSSSVTGPWSTSIPTLTSTNKYLWNYTVITYTDGTTSGSASNAVIIGTYGDTGETGNGISSIVEHYLATSASSGVTTETSGWDTQTTMTATNKYLWNYEVISYTNGNTVTTTPRIVGVYGDSGTPAYVWNFIVNRDTYKRNLRLSSNNPTITLIKDIQGYTTSGSWTCTNGTLTVYDDTTAYLVIPYNNNYDTVTITLSDGTNTVSKTISVVDETQDVNGMYLGELNAIPTTPSLGDVFISGDYFIAKSSFTGTDSNSYSVGTPYYYDGSDWFNVLNISNANGVTKALNCLGGVMNSDIAVPSTAALWGWFKNLVALNAIVQNFFAKNITVGDGTGASGSGFRFRAHAYDSSGNKLSTPIFDVMYGDVTVFKVEPATGKIYFGTSFWYDPSDGAIHSYNDKVVIGSDGSITATSASIINSMFTGQINCPSFSSLNESISATYTCNFSGSAQNQCSQLTTFHETYTRSYEGEYLKATLSVDSNVAYVKIEDNTGDGYLLYAYDSSFEYLYTIVSYKRYHNYTSYNSHYPNQSYTLTVKIGGAVFKFKNLPTTSSGLSSGQIYRDSSNYLRIV